MALSYRFCRVFRTLSAALLAGACLAAPPGGSASEAVVPPDEQALADVRAGRAATARAAWWGFDPTDATRSLQAALESAAGKILVEEMGRPWIVTTIALPSDKEIVFESGVVVEAKRGAFLDKSACLFVARDCRHLTMRGQGATFRMRKSDYHAPPYEPAEWRHTLSLRGCQDVTIESLTLQESGGDGIYLGVGSEGATNRDITIRNVVCQGNNRQGISVITAENLLIEDCVFRDTRGTAPQAGIDFEPNRPDERLVNCVLRNCRSEDNAGHAYHLYLGNLHQGSPPVSIRFENCSSRGCERYSTYVGVANRAGERTVRGSIEYLGCRFEADEAAGIYIRGNEADGCRVRFEQCEIIRRDEPGTRLAPITIEAPRRLNLDVGNIEIADCVIRDSRGRRPIDLVASPLTRLRNVSGSLRYETPEGQQTFTLDTRQLAEWFPAQGLVDQVPRSAFDWREAVAVANAPVADDGSSFRLRREAAMLVWGSAAHPFELVAQVEPVGRHTPSAGILTVTSPDGKTTRLSPADHGEQTVYRFTPSATGPLRLAWQGDANATFRPVRCTTRLAVLGESLGVDLFRPTGTLCFGVPAGVRRFALQVTGAGAAETVQATVRDAAGRVVAQQDNIAAPHVFLLERRAHDANEVWSLTLERASEGVLEDVSIQALGVPSVFAARPGDVFTCPPTQ